jgi:hypothetical protein
MGYIANMNITLPNALSMGGMPRHAVKIDDTDIAALNST